MTPVKNRRRQRILINGIVQGVGFRPWVYRLAHQYALAGFISNDSSGVKIEVEGAPDRIEQFRTSLQAEPPPLAKIDSCHWEELTPQGQSEFRIQLSESHRSAATLISPDISVCNDCLHEMYDPSDRRYRYPFINCTNCGPRFTIVESVPYDRPRTSMKIFPMCPDCEREYNDPLDRRFHAQPVACPACGPKITAHSGEKELSVTDPISWGKDFLRDGQVLALRGLGGFHLAVDASNEQAVQRLRDRKHRQLKPLAMMVPDTYRIRKYCRVSDEEEALLTGLTRPIVLLRRLDDTSGIAPSVAYDNCYFGFMLPYTPLHHLLLEDVDSLVMTSGNLSEEPIAIDNDEALHRLAAIADGFLLHNRDILQRCDDSIVRHTAGDVRMIRRARGYVPQPVTLARPFTKTILAVGGELKNTVAVTRDHQIFLSQHIGDLDNPAALGFFEHCIGHLKQILEIEPKLIACDLHPEYLSTKWARGQTDLPVVPVQHHHAHLVSVMAENGVSDRTIGIILDGTGYGTDNTIWGGEVLVGDATGFDRFAWLNPVPLPGGTAAIKEPWRMALAYLQYAYGNELVHLDLPVLSAIKDSRRDTVLSMIDKRLNCPMTSSCGRLFDGISAILGLCSENNYEAQAAIKLEQTATLLGDSLSQLEQVPSIGTGPISFTDIIQRIVHMVTEQQPQPLIAAAFHSMLVERFIAAAIAARDQTNITYVGLSGGVYQNALLLDYMLRRLTAEGFTVLTHRTVPTNDGAVALGQAVIADAAAPE